MGLKKVRKEVIKVDKELLFYMTIMISHSFITSPMMAPPMKDMYGHLTVLIKPGANGIQHIGCD